jgi:hypothetical protein
LRLLLSNTGFSLGALLPHFSFLCRLASFLRFGAGLGKLGFQLSAGAVVFLGWHG